MLIKCHLSLPSDHLKYNLICKAALKLLFDYHFVGIFAGSEKDNSMFAFGKDSQVVFFHLGMFILVVLNSVF